MEKSFCEFGEILEYRKSMLLNFRQLKYNEKSDNKLYGYGKGGFKFVFLYI